MKSLPVLGLLFLASCSAGTDGARDALLQAQQHAHNEEWGEVYDAFDSASRRFLDLLAKFARTLQMMSGVETPSDTPPRELFVRYCSIPQTSLRKAMLDTFSFDCVELISSDDDSATFSINAQGRDKFRVVREGDVWKISYPTGERP